MTKSNEWARYKKADNAPIPRLIWASYGGYGSGKTTFALGAPGPIVVQSLDRGLEGVIEPFQDQKDIYVAEYDWSPGRDLNQNAAIELRDKFVEDFEHAVVHARTVIWDKETDVWELFRYAEFGAPTDVPNNYAALYQRYRRLFNVAKATSVNFGVIQSMKEKWTRQVNPKTGKMTATPSGEFDRAGCNEIEGLVHVNLCHRRTPGGLGESSIFYIDVGKTRGPGSRDIQDQSFDGLDFMSFAQMVFPESEQEHWS